MGYKQNATGSGRPNIVFTGWFDDGTVYVTINGIQYVYYLSVGHIRKAKAMAVRAPGRALNFIKEVSYHCEKEGLS